MNIVPQMPDDCTIEEAARMAQRSTKTLRRAIQDGHFARQYIITERGPQLIFRRDELERWLLARGTRARAPRRPRPPRDTAGVQDWAEMHARVSELQALLDVNRLAIEQLVVRLHDQDVALLRAQALITMLAGKLTGIQDGSPLASPAIGAPPPERAAQEPQ